MDMTSMIPVKTGLRNRFIGYNLARLVIELLLTSVNFNFLLRVLYIL